MERRVEGVNLYTFYVGLFGTRGFAKNYGATPAPVRGGFVSFKHIFGGY